MNFLKRNWFTITLVIIVILAWISWVLVVNPTVQKAVAQERCLLNDIWPQEYSGEVSVYANVPCSTIYKVFFT